MAKEKLHFFHIVVTIFMAQLGVDVFRLPNIVAEEFGTNGWIAIIIASAVVTLHIYLISLVYRLGKGQSVFQILENSIPRFILYPLYIGLSILIGLLGSGICMHYIYIVQMMSFPTTNSAILSFMLIFLAVLFVTLGIYNMAKAATLFFFFTFWTLSLLFFHFTEFEFVRLTTHLFSDGKNYFTGGLKVLLSFDSFEIFLFFFPYVQKQTKLFKAVFLGHMLTTFVYLSINLICFGFFSLEQLKYTMFPAIELLSYIQLPFVERIENMVFNIFIGEIVVTMGFYYWIAKESLSRVFTKVKDSILLLIIVLVTFIFALQFETLRDIQKMMFTISIMYGVFMVCLPILLLVILLWKRRKGKR